MPNALRTWLSLAVLASLGGALPGCDDTPAEAQAPPEAPRVTIGLAEVDRTPVRGALALPGLVFPRETYELGFPMGGVVREVLVREGARVRAGDPIARLDPTAVRASHDQARHGLVRAERELERARSLSESGSLPSVVFDEAATGADVARASVAAAGYAMRHSVLRAPCDGVIDVRMVDPGEVVGPGTPVVRLVGAREGWALRIGVPDRFIAAVRNGDVATVRLDATGEREYPARVAEVARVPTAGMGTFDVELALELPEGLDLELRTGLVGRAVLPSGPEHTASVPSGSIVDGRDRDASVYVVRDGHAHRVPVRLAFVRGDRAVIERGLEDVDQVVALGADRLADGVAVTVSEER